MDNLRVLHCLTGQAGQPFINSRAQRKLGVKADCVIFGPSQFNYEADFIYETPQRGAFQPYVEFLKRHIDDYDVFHFYARPFLLQAGSSLAAPSYHDLLALRLAGKKVVFNFRGTEARSPSKFARFSPYNYVDENPNGVFNKWTDLKVEESIKFVKSIAHKVLVTDPEIQSYVIGGEIVPRAIDTELWYPRPVSENPNKRPLIVHAPSKRAIKGTSNVLSCIQSLKTEGYDFDFKLVEGMSNNAAKDLYARADIIIDQLRIGWYGVLAVECMALGKPVLAYIRDDLINTLGKTPPLVPTSPATLNTDLRHLLNNQAQLVTIGQRARAHAEKVHDSMIVNKALIQHYSDTFQEDSAPDISVIFDFFLAQGRDTMVTNTTLLKKIKQLQQYQSTWRFLLVQLLKKARVFYPIKRLLERG